MKNYALNEVAKVNTIKEILNLAVKEDGDKNAFEYRDENDNEKIIKKTYKEFAKDTEELGTALASIGVQDKHIAIIGENSYKWITVYLAVLKSTGVFVPIDRELKCNDVIKILKHSDTSVLFYSKRYEEWIPKIKEKIPEIKFFIGLNKEKKDGITLGYDEFKESGKKILEQGSTIYTSLEDDVNNFKMLVYTSGTTGDPKGVMLTEHNLVSVAYYGLRIADVGDRSLSVLPYHHTYEAIAGIIVQLHNHTSICINDSLKNVLKNIQYFKPDTIYLVPAFTEVFYKNIWNTASKTGKDKTLKKIIPISNTLRKAGIDLRPKLFKSIYDAFGGNLKEIVCGGAPIRPEIGKFFNDIGINLLNGYGITECSPLVSVNRIKFNDSSTVGVPLPCVQIEIRNTINDDGDGEIWVKGDIVMMGYYKDKEKTDKVLQDGWFNTEDYGRLNEKGQLIINGRKKNLIVLSNGKNIYPEEIENYILGIPYVQEVLVKTNKQKGVEKGLCAEVFLNKEKVEEMNITDVEKKLKQDIEEVCKNLPMYKQIAKIIIRKNEFEKTTTNKIKR